MRNFFTLLLLVMCFGVYAQVTVVDNKFTLPYRFNESGTSLFYVDFASNAYLWDGKDVKSVKGGKSMDYSFSARTLVGSVVDTVDGNDVRLAAYYDLAKKKWTSLPLVDSIPLSGFSYSSAWGINEAGDKTVGLVFRTPAEAHAFLWNKDSGFTLLPNVSDTRGSRANGISKQGDIIYGHVVSNNSHWVPAIWIDDKITTISDGSDFGSATCASYDGTYVAGNVGRKMFIWSKDNLQYIDIEDSVFKDAGITVPDEMYVSAIADDKTIYGVTVPYSSDGRRAFIYNKKDGFRTLSKLIKDEMNIDSLGAYVLSSSIIATRDGKKLSSAGLRQEKPYGAATFVFELGSTHTDEVATYNSLVYPTVVNDNVNIALSNKAASSQEMKVTISSEAGQIMYTNSVLLHDTFNERIALDGYTSGVYFVTLRSQEEVRTVKIIKE